MSNLVRTRQTFGQGLPMAEISVSFKRTLHPAHPSPNNKHSHRYPHHYQHTIVSSRRQQCPSTRNIGSSSISSSSSCNTHASATTNSSYLSKFLILLFLSICDNRACRTLTLTEAATVVFDSSSSTTTVPILATSSSSSSSSTISSITTSQVVDQQQQHPKNAAAEDFSHLQPNPTSSSDSSDSSGSESSTIINSSSTEPIIDQMQLQQIVMEGLGLSSIPDVRAMNISQQEYETKYREYLERVNRRNANRELNRRIRRDVEFEPEQETESMADDDTPDEEDSWVEQRHLYSFPNSGHKLNHQNLRRKRSLSNNYDLVYIRFDVPTRNATTGELTGINSPSMYHDPFEHHGAHHHRRHHQTLSELPPISPENIEESSLNLMLTWARIPNGELGANGNGKQPQMPAFVEHDQQHGRNSRKGRIKFKHNGQSNAILGSGKSGNFMEPSHHRGGKTINLHIYQLVEPYERHWLTTKTIALADIGFNDKKWFQLPMDEAVRTWLDGSRKNLGLEIYCENCFNNNVFVIHDSSPFFTTYDEIPVLNVVGRLVQREKRSKIQRFRPTKSDYISPPKHTSCTSNNKRCCRHPLLVDFRDLVGYDFIIQPKTFDAGFCRGRCPYKYNAANNHALIQSMLHEHKDYNVPKPCCAPSKLESIDILHADPVNPQRLKVSTWINMRVTECACT
ncbi:uncharacterized protein LOC129748136 [Uranotaenia lowii]|uniref:uncharacterized protein LOC129748136 n=1 Tax=Uranotaenia lowii TaxID=190385 RepID=UPI00247AC0E9|nr:uncharacterized protein LOC129748136 [Uranotaenia lowii]